ncbi:hypothetical protein O1611_g5822 [Lasiodiplodia mahajangana]|uniref:Uncharacterized protein n=1 Tax=Lasiodiplodia mahajangana TaxID=1108764 RepID=A0ACC2JKR4_9PEZI|nr:hypothetical protein O1611_g5822 [Lasiodiplodia mahajangana]
MQLSNVLYIAFALVGSISAAPMSTEEVDAGLFTSLDGVWASYGYDEKKKAKRAAHNVIKLAKKDPEEVDAGLFTSLDGVWASYGYDE